MLYGGLIRRQLNSSSKLPLIGRHSGREKSARARKSRSGCPGAASEKTTESGGYSTISTMVRLLGSMKTRLPLTIAAL